MGDYADLSGCLRTPLIDKNEIEALFRKRIGVPIGGLGNRFVDPISTKGSFPVTPADFFARSAARVRDDFVFAAEVKLGAIDAYREQVEVLAGGKNSERRRDGKRPPVLDGYFFVHDYTLDRYSQFWAIRHGHLRLHDYESEVFRVWSDAMGFNRASGRCHVPSSVDRKPTPVRA